MPDSETPNPPKKPLSPLAAAFGAGVAVTLGCVLVGFWMGRRPQPRTRVETNSAMKTPSAVSRPSPNNGIATSPSTQADAHPNAAAGANAQPAVVRGNGTRGAAFGVFTSQATAAPAPPVVASAPSRTEFAIEMSPVATPQKATELVTILKNLGYNASIVSGDARSRNALYRVEAGPYASRDDAELAASKMRLEGLDPADVAARNLMPVAPSTAPASVPVKPVSSAPANSPTVPTQPARVASQPLAHHKTLPPLPSPVASGFAVQVQARRDREGAEALVNRLKSLGYPAFVQAPGPQDTDSLFRVKVGFYATRSEARAVRDRLRSKGFRPFVKEPSPSEAASAGTTPQAPLPDHP